jgi:hypothetical protein
MTLREALEKLSDEDLEILMQEHIDWEENQFVPDHTELRKYAKVHLGVDNTLQMDRVASEAFRVYALRAAGMR